MRIEKAKIISNHRVADNCYKISLDSKKISGSCHPGQFINLKLNNNYRPLLRKPFSIHGVKGSWIQLLYRVVGQGTEILSRKRPGERLDIIGPLGKGFNYSFTESELSIPLLVAGGMGVAPLFYLASKISAFKPLVLIGAKTSRQILCKNDFKKIGCGVKIATDDGSLGYKGKVTDLLRRILKSSRLTKKTSIIYACGPEAMLKEIRRISRKYRLAGQVSLEAYMACGFGVCLGCSLDTKTGYKLVCKDGPVFDIRQLI